MKKTAASVRQERQAKKTEEQRGLNYLLERCKKIIGNQLSTKERKKLEARFTGVFASNLLEALPIYTQLADPQLPDQERERLIRLLHPPPDDERLHEDGQVRTRLERMAFYDTNAIEKRHPIVAFFEKRGIKVINSPSQCPFKCEGGSKCFSVDNKNNRWRCEGKCTQQGGVIEALMKLESIEHDDACAKLGGRKPDHLEHRELAKQLATALLSNEDKLLALVALKSGIARERIGKKWYELSEWLLHRWNWVRHVDAEIEALCNLTDGIYKKPLVQTIGENAEWALITELLWHLLPVKGGNERLWKKAAETDKIRTDKRGGKKSLVSALDLSTTEKPLSDSAIRQRIRRDKPRRKIGV